MLRKTVEISEDYAREMLEEYEEAESSKTNQKHIFQYRKLLTFFKYDVKVSLTPENNALINDKFVFALNTNRWRNVNKWVWYRSNGPRHFLLTYVKAQLKSKKEKADG